MSANYNRARKRRANRKLMSGKDAPKGRYIHYSYEPIKVPKRDGTIEETFRAVTRRVKEIIS